MNDAELTERVKSALGEKLGGLSLPAPRRFFIKVAPQDLVAATAALKEALGMTHVSTISGVDLGETFEILYHFSIPEADLNLRTEVPRSRPLLPSICSVIPGAILYERELQDMFGLVVEGIPDGRRLILPDDWPDGQYPLRKDWKYERPAEVIPGGES